MTSSCGLLLNALPGHTSNIPSFWFAALVPVSQQWAFVMRIQKYFFSLLVLLWLWEQLYLTGFQLLKFLLELFILQQRARHSLKTNVIMRALPCHLICSQSPPKGPTSPHHQYVTLRIWLLTWTLQWYIKLNYTSYTSSFNSQFPVIPARVIESLV